VNCHQAPFIADVYRKMRELIEGWKVSGEVDAGEIVRNETLESSGFLDAEIQKLI
jgi:hypothetical protein